MVLAEVGREIYKEDEIKYVPGVLSAEWLMTLSKYISDIHKEWQDDPVVKAWLCPTALGNWSTGFYSASHHLKIKPGIFYSGANSAGEDGDLSWKLSPLSLCVSVPYMWKRDNDNAFLFWAGTACLLLMHNISCVGTL